MATGKSSEVERWRSPVRGRRTRTRPSTEAGRVVKGSSRGRNRSRAGCSAARYSIQFVRCAPLLQ